MKPDGTVNRGKLATVFNPDDLHALELALNLKDRNPNNSYIHLKKINQVTNGVGLEYQKYYTKQDLFE